MAFVRTNNCMVHYTHTPNAYIDICDVFVYIFVRFDIAMFTHVDHLFVQSFNCLLIQNLRQSYQLSQNICLEFFRTCLIRKQLRSSRRLRKTHATIITFGLDSVSVDLSSSLFHFILSQIILSVH